MFRIIGSIIILIIAGIAYVNLESELAKPASQPTQPIQSDDSLKTFKIN